MVVYSPPQTARNSREEKKEQKKTRENRVTATSFFIRIFVIFLYHTFIPSPFSLLKKIFPARCAPSGFFFKYLLSFPVTLFFAINLHTYVYLFLKWMDFLV